MPESRPVMAMTTGTSGFPRGVRHEWDRLLRAVRKIKPAPDHRWLLAYGLNQFGGLQILIHVLAAQARLVAAESFQPRDALGAMRASGVTHASGTPTFWRFLVAEMSADGGPVPGLRQVTLGGEAVPGALLERLRERFPDAHLSQIYGATEFGQNVTVRDGRPGLPVSMLESGGDVQFKITDGEPVGAVQGLDARLPRRGGRPRRCLARHRRPGRGGRRPDRVPRPQDRRRQRRRRQGAPDPRRGPGQQGPRRLPGARLRPSQPDGWPRARRRDRAGARVRRVGGRPPGARGVR
ncbi:long-chain fatty acid--CoA ligase [Nocardioides sp. W3-2-3]|uniref:AMP-binding protein n=1 Tax=Nocardioides convexus TaxID=2712224 RepID=UPI00241842EB|nr:AMP-binding protein [Nocardioides convexus]NHA01562.1 long-chain fatty acid--CoA ligase [Nocardioides convexus]